MACKGYTELIDKYIEGLATHEEETTLMKHIEYCKDCQQELVELREILKTTSSLEMKDLPLNFTPLLAAKLKEVSAEHNTQKKHLPLIGFFKDLPALLSNIYINIKRTNYAKAVLSLCIIGLYLVFVLKPYDTNFFSTKQATESAPREMERASTMMDSARDEVKAGSSIDMQESADNGNQSLGSTSNEIKSKAINRKIIRNVDVSLYVEDFDEKTETILMFAEELGGYVENSYVEEGAENAPRRAHIAMRVPQEKLPQALELIKPLGRLKSQHLSGDDITENYYDTTARVENLRKQEKRLLEILTMAENVDEILKIENELNRVRTDIDVMVGQIMTWDKMVEFSLINLNLIEQQPSKEKIKDISFNTFIERGRQGFITSINFLFKTLIVLSEILGVLVILLILAGIIFFIRFLYGIYKKYRK